MSLLRSTLIVSIFTFLSRILGYVRDILMAMTLGASVIADAFFVAFRFPNFFRTLTAEGAFSAAFVPIFTKKINKDGKEEAVIFASKAFSFMFFVLVCFTVTIEIIMPSVIKILAPGFINDQYKFDLTVKIARILFPYLIFTSIVALMSGMLNAIGKFAFTASVSIWLNICIITALLLSVKFDLFTLNIISYSVVISGVMQVLWVFFATVRYNISVKFMAVKIDSDLKSLFKTMVPGIVGGGVTQINLWINTILATTMSSAVSYLYYADRLVQFPLAIIGTAMGTVLLPSLSKSINNVSEKKFFNMQNRAIEITMIFIIPAACAFFVMGDTLISVMFERGKFDEIATAQTARALAIYATALPAFVLIKIFSPVFFAKFDTKTPVKIAFMSLIINVVTSLSLMAKFDHVALAIATSASSWMNALSLILILFLRKLYRPTGMLFVKLAKITMSAIAMIFVIILCKNYLNTLEINQIISLILLIFIGLFAYFVILLSLKTTSIKDLKSI